MAVAPRSAPVTAPGPSMGLGVQVHRSGLLFTAQQSLGMWEQVGSRLFSFADSSTWWIADWLVYGETTFRDRYEEAIKQTSLSYQTLRNYTWVARRFPLDRRRQALSFSHHLEVVALDRPEQDYWLRKAEELAWSRNRLRAEVRASLATRHTETPQLAADDGGEVSEAGETRSAGDAGAAASAAAAAAAEAGRPSRSSAGSGAGAGVGVGSAAAVDRHLRLAVSAEELTQLECAARKHGASLEIWAAEILRRAAADA